MPILLIGNKCDLESKRVIDTAVAKDFAKAHGLPYLETSAKMGSGVEEAFMQLAKRIVETRYVHLAWNRVESSSVRQRRLTIRSSKGKT
jgi:Ras-related protein Rab-1A